MCGRMALPGALMTAERSMWNRSGRIWMNTRSATTTSRAIGMMVRIGLLGELAQVGFRLPQGAGERRALSQAGQVGRGVPRRAEGHHHVRVEERRSRGAVGHGEDVAHGPGLRGHRLVD